jgi:hypothetical protein
MKVLSIPFAVIFATFVVAGPVKATGAELADQVEKRQV